MTEIDIVLKNLREAKCPEDVFLGNGTEADVKQTFRRLARAVHPDHNPDQKTQAIEAFQLLNKFHAAAGKKFEAGTWGKREVLDEHKPITIDGTEVEPKPIRGDIADIYLGQHVAIKVARNASDNDLIRAEFQNVQFLHKKIPSPVVEGLPLIIRDFMAGAMVGTNRQGIVLDRLEPQWRSAQEVVSLIGQVDERTAVWMFKRLLTLLKHAHHEGVVHGAVLPNHVLFFPDNANTNTYDPKKHALRLIDWCYSVKFKERTRLSSWVPAWESHYPTEIRKKTYIGPESDIYMAAKVMEYMLDHVTLPAELGAVLANCMREDYTKRYHKASDAWEEWNNAARKVFGERKWHDFNLPQ